MRYIILTAIVLLYTSISFAQSTGSISGKLQDSSSKQALPLATITVFHAKDTAIITYRLSGPDGEFKVPGLPLDVACRAVVSYSGYSVYRHEFQLSKEQPQLNIGVVMMKATAANLEEVLVTAERPPVSVKKDTIEFNATAFKTLPTALVEDLLRKLPGVDVDKEGNITVNGKAVSRILVDGKDFFGGDPKVATRNLPATIIDKVQVTDDRELLDRNPDISKADVAQVINLKLKKSIKKGWFGKLYAGGGTDDRYEAGGIVNLFRDTLQVSALAYTNNINKPGFGMSDIQRIGGFDRSGFNTLFVNAEGGYSLNGISFGATGQGIQKSSGAGINMSTEFGKRATLNFQYFHGQNESSIRQLLSTQQNFADTILSSRSNNEELSRDYNHRFGGSLKWKIDSLTTLTFRPSFTMRKLRLQRDVVANSIRNFRQLLNESTNQQRSFSNEFGYSHEFSTNTTFRKKGRTLFFSNSINTADNESDQFNDIYNQFYLNGAMVDSSYNQLRRRDYTSFRTGFYVTYNEPISKKLSLRLSESLEYFKDNDGLNTFNRQQQSDKYELPNELLSNGLARDGWRSTTTAGLKFTHKKLSIIPGINLQTLNIDNVYLKNPDVQQNFRYILPSLNISWNKINFNYRVNIQEPRATDLQPVVDNTNPLYLQLGNPLLQPTLSHNLHFNFFKFDNVKGVNFSIYFNGSFDNDAIIRQRVVDEKGVQITTPVNVDGTWRFYTSNHISKQIKFNKDWQLTLKAGLFGSVGRNLIIVNGIRSQAMNYGMSPQGGGSFNYKDLFEINQKYTLSFNKSRYESQQFQNLDVLTHSSETELVVRWPKNLVFESSVDYRYNPQVSPGIRKSIVKWNAGINYLFLKGNKGQLKLSVYDLLNQNISVYRTARENFIQDNQLMVLQRYYMLTFTYNLSTFSAGKVGGKDKLFIF